MPQTIPINWMLLSSIFMLIIILTNSVLPQTHNNTVNIILLPNTQNTINW